MRAAIGIIGILLPLAVVSRSFAADAPQAPVKESPAERAERFLTILADDHQTDQYHIGAAEALTARIGGKKAAMEGEMLRKRAGPSVGDLLARRLKEAYESAGDDMQRWTLAARFARALGFWEGKDRLPELRAFTQALSRRYLARHEGRDYLCQWIDLVCAERIELGDETAFADYAEWIKHFRRQDLKSGVRWAFDIMAKHGDRPDMADLSESLFNQDGSSWNPILRPEMSVDNLFAMEMFSTPLVGLPAVQKQLLQQLDDKQSAGTASVNPNGEFKIKSAWGWSLLRNEIAMGDASAPAAGESRDFRVCDCIVDALSPIDGYPRIELYWPAEKRDAAVARTKELLLQYGKRLAWNSQYATIGLRSVTEFTFAPLDHAATAEDVANGLAIFSLGADAKPVPLPPGMLRAKWEGLHTWPQRLTKVDPKTGTKIDTVYWQQWGHVWQAEERQVQGKREVWYGFAGPGFMGKVKAEEIFFQGTDASEWIELGNGVELQLQRPEGPIVGNGGLVEEKAGDPVEVKLRARNVRGLEQEVSAEWYRPKEKSLAANITLHAQIADNEAAYQMSLMGRNTGWKDVSLNLGPSFTQQKTQTLGVMEQGSAEVVDLKELGLVKPGIYRIYIEKTGGDGMRGAYPVLIRIVSK